jgi:superfamily II DNA or RNA helicase
LCAPSGFGKTVVSAKLIAERVVNTLILVHRQQLLEQWRARLAACLDLPANAIGHALAFQSTTTRVATVTLGREKSRTTFPELTIAFPAPPNQPLVSNLVSKKPYSGDFSLAFAAL